MFPDDADCTISQLFDKMLVDAGKDKDMKRRIHTFYKIAVTGDKNWNCPTSALFILLDDAQITYRVINFLYYLYLNKISYSPDAIYDYDFRKNYIGRN